MAVLAVWNAWLVGHMAFHRQVGLPATANLRWIHVALFGFAANMIFGFSLRVLPHFLGLREPRVWAANLGWLAWNVPVLLRYRTETLDLVAAILELVGAVLVVIALGIFEKRRVKIDIRGVDPAFGWFIVLGFVWLMLDVAQPFHADLGRYTASARHGMTVGFIMSVILGVACRVLPIFNGVNLHSNKLLRVTFWHHLAGTTMVLAMALSATRTNPWWFVWTVVGGYCALAALLMFVWNIYQTLRVRAEKFTAHSLVSLQTRVTELLETFPELRPVLIHGGLSGLATMQYNPPRFVTLEFAARRHGLDPHPLVKILNDEIQRRKKL